MKKCSIISAVLFLIIGLFVSCNFGIGGNSDGNSSGSNVTSLKACVISPAAGDYAEGYKEITITSDNDNKGDIYYTTDGTTPTVESSRYTGPFKIIGTKTVKAIAIYNDVKSVVITSQFNLNAGKSSSQLGVVYGRVSISDNLEDSVKTELADSIIYVYTDQLSGVVKQVKAGEEYYFDGLDTSKSYNFYFSNKEPEIFPETDNSRKIKTLIEEGKSIIATKLTVKPEEGNGVQAEATLKAAGTISGTARRYNVLGELEEDQAGTTVFIPGTSYAAYTNENGRFVISGVPQGSYTVRAQLSGYKFSEKENILLQSEGDEIPQTDIEDEFKVAFAQGIVKGTVVLSDATSTSAMSGIDVVMYSSDNKYSYPALTSASGVYSMTDVYPGTYTVEISKEGYETAVITGIVVTGASVTTIPITSLQVIGGNLSGSVSINGKTDLSGISILAESSEGKSFFAVTNKEGKFSWEKVSPGMYTISASYAGYKTSSISGIIVTIGRTVSDIVIPDLEKSTYSISGKVFLEGMESGFEGTAILVKDTGTLESVANTVTGTDGTFFVSDIEPGNYQLTISRDGYLTNNSTVVSVRTNAVEVIDDVILKNAAGAVTGTVTMENAVDNAGIAILIISQTDSTKTYSTVTDSTGHFSVSGVKPDTYKVQATKSGYNNGYSDAFVISAGSTENVTAMQITVAQRSLYGNVTLEGRTDFSGIKITATNINNVTEIYSALTNNTGVFAMSGMTPGEYILSYSYDGYVSKTSSSISLSETSSIKVDDVELLKATGKISGIVNLEGCTDHSGITVSLVGTDKTYTTESDGSYEFTVPSGNYPGGVRFSKEDYQLTAKAETITVLTDSTYGVLTVEMKATANTVKGTVDLAGNDDDSGISVSIDEYPEIASVVTTSDGKWELEHVPVNADSYVTVRFTRVNTPDVTTQIKVIANDYVEISSIEMIPNAATLKGHVYLTDMTDHSNIVITVKTDGKDDIIARTTSDGAFEITNILATGSHDIIFSKNGWDSQTITIDDFSPMEERTLSDSINLTDTTAPVINSVLIEEGINFTNSSTLNIKLDVNEFGSGITNMAIQVKAPEYENLYPSVLDWQDYKIAFTKDLSEMPSQVYTGNGEYIIYVTLKDEAGNISTTVSDSIGLTDQTSILKGVLTGTNLNLTKAKSPYRVESNCLVGNGSTLSIEPGVQIEFAGNYYLKINGAIKAVGTADNEIIFKKSSDNTESWHGLQTTEDCEPLEMVDHNYVDGNILEYCVIQDAEYPLNWVESTIYTSGTGSVYINKCIFQNNQHAIQLHRSSSVIENSELNEGVILSCSYGDTGNEYIVNNKIQKDLFVKLFDSYNLVIQNNDIKNCKINLNPCSQGTGFEANFGTFLKNTIYNSSIDIDTSNTVSNFNFKNNNFIQCPDIIVDCSYVDYSVVHEFDFTNNYWGEANTEELNLIGTRKDASFILDYYNDFNKAEINYSSWETSEIAEAGYKGDSFDWSTVTQ